MCSSRLFAAFPPIQFAAQAIWVAILWLAAAFGFNPDSRATTSSEGAAVCPGDVDDSGEVNVADLLAVINAWGQHAVVVNVTVTNYEYMPGSFGARAGDTVRWIEDVGFHTVTSGADCTPDGRFNAAINSARPQFEYTLGPMDVGALEYFCIPHCSGQGMFGSIQVEPFPEDLTIDGVVNAADLLAVINAWGPCR